MLYYFFRMSRMKKKQGGPLQGGFTRKISTEKAGSEDGGGSYEGAKGSRETARDSQQSPENEWLEDTPKGRRALAMPTNTTSRSTPALLRLNQKLASQLLVTPTINPPSNDDPMLDEEHGRRAGPPVAGRRQAPPPLSLDRVMNHPTNNPQNMHLGPAAVLNSDRRDRKK